MGGGTKKKNSVSGFAAGAGAGIAPALTAGEAPGGADPPVIPAQETPSPWSVFWQWSAEKYHNIFKKGGISAAEMYLLANEKAKELGIPTPLAIQTVFHPADEETAKKELAGLVAEGKTPVPPDMEFIDTVPADNPFWAWWDEKYAAFLGGEISADQLVSGAKAKAAELGLLGGPAENGSGLSGAGGGDALPFPGSDSTKEEPVPAGPVSPAAPPETPDWLLEASPVREDFWNGVEEAGPLGRPFLVAGPDIEDQTLTATVFQDPGGDPSKARTVLFGKLREESEGKLLDALDLEGSHVMKVKRQVEKEAPLFLDEKEGLYAQLLKVAKSVNYHTGEGKDNVIPDHTLKGMAELRDKLEKLQGIVQDEKNQAMVQNYLDQLKAVESAVASKTKAPFVKQYFTPQLVEVEEEVVVPSGKGEGLPAQKRTGSRIKAAESGGAVTWDGGRETSSFYGVEYAIDLGDGYQAVYHPNDKSVPFSLRGTLEVIAPQGVKDGREALQKLKMLHLHAEPPATAAEAEVMYLERNIWAQGYEKDPEYRAIGRRLEALEMKQEAKLLAALGGADGLGEEEKLALAKELVLQNQRALLAEKTRLLKRFFEKKLGLAPGGLDKLPTYRPEPGAASRQKGFHFWNRFDLKPEEVRQKTKGYRIVHRIEGAGDSGKAGILCRVIESGGVLAATETRYRMGISHKGVSSKDDMKTGGAAYAFTFMRPVQKQDDFDIVWDPEVLLTRSDWFATKGDDFGATNPSDSHFKESGRTKDIDKLLSWKSNFSGWGGQVMFKNGIDLLGEHAPRYIFVNSEADRQKVLASFAKVGVKELGGRPVEEVVQVR